MSIMHVIAVFAVMVGDPKELYHRCLNRSDSQPTDAAGFSSFARRRRSPSLARELAEQLLRQPASYEPEIAISRQPSSFRDSEKMQQLHCRSHTVLCF